MAGWTTDLILGLADIPQWVSAKTLFSSTRHGLGCSHFGTLWPQRCLDVAHKFIAREKDRAIEGALDQLKVAAACLGAEVDTSLPRECDDRDQGLPVHTCPVVLPSPEAPTGGEIFSDGSFDPQLNVCAGAVLMEDGTPPPML